MVLCVNPLPKLCIRDFQLLCHASSVECEGWVPCKIPHAEMDLRALGPSLPAPEKDRDWAVVICGGNDALISGSRTLGVHGLCRCTNFMIDVWHQGKQTSGTITRVHSDGH